MRETSNRRNDANANRTRRVSSIRGPARSQITPPTVEAFHAPAQRGYVTVD